MQTPAGRELLVRHGIDPDDPVSFLLLEQGHGYTDTDGITRVLRSLGGRWAMAGMLVRVFPRFIRDPSYRWIARNRYRLFGRHDTCLLPSNETADRFLT